VKTGQIRKNGRWKNSFNYFAKVTQLGYARFCEICDDSGDIKSRWTAMVRGLSGL
jgi:hypothetical protein